jgi:hypothetical protein
MSGYFLDNERLADLLALQATEGLSEPDQHELNELLRSYPAADPQVLDSTAAALFLAGDWEEEPMPESVRRRLNMAAAEFAAVVPKVSQIPEPRSRPREVKPSASRSSGFAWFAAAASIVVAVAAWIPRLEYPQSGKVDLLSQASLDSETLAGERQKLLASAKPLQKEWSATEDPAGTTVKGDVVWDAASQTGYMRFTGLPANDPGTLQYQLWIFDETRDDRYPVDGGVFNIPSGGGEVVVPILAKLPIRTPKLFAVTIERPGGAVVSARERIVVVAAVSTG